MTESASRATPGVLWREYRRWMRASAPSPRDGRPPSPIAGLSAQLVVAQSDYVRSAEGVVNQSLVRRLLAGALSSVTSTTGEAAAWLRLLPNLRPTDVIGIKVNTVATHLAGHREVIDAVVASLAAAGVTADRIVIWDNLGRLGPLRNLIYGNVNRRSGSYYQGMERAGYTLSASSSPRVMCTVPVPPGVAYDPTITAKIPSLGLRLPVTRLLTEICDHVINVPVVKDHRVTGMTCALKNFYGSVPLWDDLHPGNADRMHQARGNPQIAELYANPVVSGKVRVHIVDAL
ncbi:MAG TPA: DUF362 domain-containing protein, partial [Acidimicrobiales bacterium]|nr:DUF362 domain-containing protein [Acidimicrobiales bacterium]